MTKNRSRNPKTKKGGRTITTTTTKKPASKPTTKRAAPAKQNLTKQRKVKTPVKSAPAAKKAAPKKSKAVAKPVATLTTAQRIIDALENLKGKDIVAMDVRKLTDVTDTLVIVSGTSNRHVKSLADNTIMEMKKAGHRAYGIEGNDAGEWVLVDFGDVVLHVMQPHIREFYDLEKLWSTPVAPTEE